MASPPFQCIPRGGAPLCRAPARWHVVPRRVPEGLGARWAATPLHHTTAQPCTFAVVDA